MARGNRKSPWRWLVLIIVILFLLGLPFFYWQFLNSPVDKNNTKVKAFVIQKGESTESIVANLKQAGLIRSEMAFKWHLKNSGAAGTIQAGDFKLSPAMSYSQIVDKLKAGAIDQWVTLIEGWRVEQMANRIEAELGLDGDEFIKLAEEGYMFPDTYLINKEATMADVVSILKNTFKQRFDQSLQDKVKALGLTPQQAVIMASIVEREGRSEKVRTEVASILVKRWKMGMKLDADATVQYANDSQQLASGDKRQEFKFWQPITREDYQNVKSDYNTYLTSELPPSPICNPSLASLRAVANADPSTPYVFYYHDSQGNSYYARTLEEHENNAATYR